MKVNKFSSKHQCYLYTAVWLLVMIVFAYLPILVEWKKGFSMFWDAYVLQQHSAVGIIANVGFGFFVCWDYYLMCIKNVPKHFFLCTLVAIVLEVLIFYYTSVPEQTITLFSWKTNINPALLCHGVFLIIIFWIKKETVINTNLKK